LSLDSSTIYMTISLTCCRNTVFYF
jgi:hypothetical protein